MITINDTIITIVLDDITNLAVDAIVNAANTELKLGSGVAGAIRQKGGPSIQKECDAIGGTPVGTAVITGAGNLPAKHVIHAVGPVMGSGDEDTKLANATRSALELAEKNKIRSIAIPAISTGIFGFPVARCAKIMITTTIAFLRERSQLDKVIFCLYSNDIYTIFENEITKFLSE
ncbi:macro domain-containing protein [bacterium]|nr:macro domain-containing protein [candidate division CSSED10-310 bacterium]